MGYNQSISNFINNSGQLYPEAKWTFLPVITLIITIFAILFNSILLLAFIVAPHLRTAFNMYIVNLLICNWIHCVFQKPLDILDTIYPHWPLSSSFCTFYIWLQYNGNAVIIHGHLLITLNRIWAVLSPFTYKTYHNRRTAILICCGMWLYVNVLLLPEVIMDDLYHRLDLDRNHCLVNIKAQLTLCTVMELGLFSIPLGFILLSYPFVMLKRLMRGKQKTASITTVQPPVHDKAHGQRSREETSRKKSISRSSSNAYTVFTLLTLSMAVCWVPLIVVYTANLLTGYFNFVFFETASVLYSLEAALDPVFFVVSLREIRDAVAAMMPTFAKKRSTRIAMA